MPTDPKHVVAVCALVFNQRQEILLVKTPGRGWECPGGQVELGEDLLAALEREVLEESSCHVQVRRLVGVYTNPVPPEKVIFMFTGDHLDGEPRPSHEALGAGWFSMAEALDLVTFPACRARLQDALAAGDRPVYRVYTARPYATLKEALL